MQPFNLETVTAGDDCAVLRVSGEVDVYTAPQMRERVIELLADGSLHIVADLLDVDFLDSTGLGVLVGSLKRLRERDGSLTLVASSAGRIPQLLRLTALDRVFTLRQSVLEAIAGDRYWEEALTAEGSGAEEWCRKQGLR